MKMLPLALLLVVVPAVSFASGSQPASPAPQINKIDGGKPALSLSQQGRWALMAGRWYGSEIQKDGGRYMWIDDRQIDGRYTVHFRVIDPSGKRTDKIETGEWGVAGNIYFSIYKGDLKGDSFVPVDPTDPYNRDAYRILKLNEECFEYESIDSDNKYTARKVSADFTFPE